MIIHTYGDNGVYEDAEMNKASYDRYFNDSFLVSYSRQINMLRNRELVQLKSGFLKTTQKGLNLLNEILIDRPCNYNFLMNGRPTSVPPEIQTKTANNFLNTGPN